MLELPEAAVIAQQLNETIRGRSIGKVIAGHSPHKFAWYHGDPSAYPALLINKTVDGATSYGGLVEIRAEDAVILLGDGINLRFHNAAAPRPAKHQLLIEFDDCSALTASVQMYGGLWCFCAGEFQNTYFLQAKEKPSPLSEQFDRVYYDNILGTPGVERLSAKALLATEQRIPGLGNGVLQDILFNAGIHPKRKVATFTSQEYDALYDALKRTLTEMISDGGRDTDKDLFGHPGKYITKLSKNTVGQPCPRCGAMIKKEAYLGGSIYYCSDCQVVAR